MQSELLNLNICPYYITDGVDPFWSNVVIADVQVPQVGAVEASLQDTHFVSADGTGFQVHELQLSVEVLVGNFSADFLG